MSASDGSQRYAFLGQSFTVFQQHFNAKWPGVPLELDRRSLFNIVESYFLDIERMQKFHEISRKDDIKRAAYTVKWILRHRPIYCPSHDLKLPHKDRALMANEMFAMFVALAMLEWRPQVLSAELWRVCYYTFRYRNFEEGMFTLFLLALRPGPGSATA